MCFPAYTLTGPINPDVLLLMFKCLCCHANRKHCNVLSYKRKMEKWKKIGCFLGCEAYLEMYIGIWLQTYKSDVFTCGIAAFTDIIYLVCTADSPKLCIYSKAELWKWWCCAKLFKVTGVSNSGAGESLTRHTWIKTLISPWEMLLL